MADIIASVLDQRSVLDSLYKRSNKGIQFDKTSFLTWSDEGRPIVDTTLAITDDDAISSWDNVYDAVRINAANARRFSDKKKNPLGLFSPSDSIFDKGNPCPSAKDTIKRLADEHLIPLIYNYQGYSFSSEFNLVYRGTFSHVTALEDLTAVIRKALQSADPAMGNDVCDQYASYIVAQTAWDASVMTDLFKRCITVRFPFIEKFQVNAEQVGMNTRVYIGKSSMGHISFTVRCESFVQISDATIKKNEEVTPIPLIFYHDHDIESPEHIKGFLQRLRFVHSEPDALRANAAVPQFTEFYQKSGVRFYFKISLPAATAPAVRAPPAALGVDSDLSDDDDGSADGSRRRTVEDKVKFDAIELDASAPTQVSCTSSFSSEVYGWGYDSFYSLGVGNASRSQAEGKGARDEGEARRKGNASSAAPAVSSLMDEVYEPRPIPISRNIALEQVKMIACSSRHSVLLTHHGCLYSCGDNAEGALGLGDMFPRNVFTLVDWSVQHKASYVACAAGVVGAHTMAVDTQGLLYGWGFTKAIGRGVVQPTLTPHAIPVPSHADTEFEDELMDDIVSQRTQQQQGQRRAPTEVERRRDDGLSSEEKRRRRMVRTVACGAGFTVCVMMSGEVYAFGQWAHGRLGLGEIPMINVRTRGLRSTPKLARYQLRPVRLLGIENAISVACGEAHVLCLLASGHVLAWGQNALGQLGIGPMRTGLLKDQFSPVLVPPFGSSLRDPHCTTYNRQLIRRFVLSGAGPRYQRRLQYLYQRPDAAHFHAVKGQQVICGAYHSIVMDRDAHCWTWGARGSPCLGHADSKILGEWATRVSNVFSVATNETEVMVPYELLPWCNLWSTPRRVRAFDTYYTATRSSALGSSEKDTASKSFYYDDYAMVDQQYQQSASMTSAGIAMETDAPVEAAAIAGVSPVAAAETVSLDDDITVISQAAIAAATTAQQGSRRQQQQRLKIIQVVAGDLHTMFITNHGRMYLCGSGPAVPPLYPSALDADEEPAGSSETSKDATTSSRGSERAVVVHSPRCPSAQWLPTVCMRAVRYVASGGSRIFALFDEETVSLNLTSLLYTSLRTPSMMTSSSNGNGDDSEDEMSKAGLTSILSGGSGLLSEYSQALLLKGRADCMVIASGYTFLCHRALLAKRSTELRDMILMETPTVSDPHGTAPDVLTQILLPELHKDAARVLCYFLYRDSLPRYALGNRVLLHALSRCGQRLKLPRLHLLSERYLALLDLPHAMNGRGQGLDDDGNDVEGGSGAILDELPPPTLSRDLGNLLGDVDFADVRFVAEGRTVAAHRFVLEARCAYFRAMFQSDFAETASMSKSHHSYGSHHSIAQQRMVEVVLPDSFVGLLRLLIFLYTDTLPDGSDGALLEDLMAADRYGLLEMKSLCENMLIPNRHNWLDLLRAADLLQAHTLKRNVVSFLRDNFHALHLDARHWQEEDERQQEEAAAAARAEAEADDFDDEGRPIYRTKTKDTSSSSNVPSTASVIQELQEEFPQLLESLLFSRTVTFPLPPNQMLITRSVSSKQARVEAEQTPFPYWALLFGAVCMYFYSQVASFVSLGPLIPSLNLGVTAIAGTYGAYRLYTELYRRKRI